MVKNNICKVCGKQVKPRGIGGHLRLAHGIIEKVVVTTQVKQYDIGTQVKNSGGDISDHKTTRVILPSEYVKKDENIKQFKFTVICACCNERIEIELHRPFAKIEYQSIKDKIVCNKCIKNFYSQPHILWAIRQDKFDKNGRRLTEYL